jgi:hypothetical protein
MAYFSNQNSNLGKFLGGLAMEDAPARVKGGSFKKQSLLSQFDSTALLLCFPIKNLKQPW